MTNAKQWDGSCDCKKGMTYLNDDSQLCQLVGTSMTMDGLVFVGELLEHPSARLDISLVADCNPLPNATEA